jgi:chemotaxis signal transduction protein
MLAIVFNAGQLSYAIPAHDVVRVIALTALRPVPAAPTGVIGLLHFDGALLATVDLRLLLEGEKCANAMSSRLIIVQINPPGRASVRFALLAESVLNMTRVDRRLVAVKLTRAPFLGDILAMQGNAPQLVDIRRLLPEAIQNLYQPSPSEAILASASVSP